MRYLTSRRKSLHKVRILYTAPKFGQYMTKEMSLPFQQDPVTKFCTFTIPEETLDDILGVLQSQTGITVTKT